MIEARQQQRLGGRAVAVVDGGGPLSRLPGSLNEPGRESVPPAAIVASGPASTDGATLPTVT